MITLNHIYNETILRLARTIELLNNLEKSLASIDDKNTQIDIKQRLIDGNVNPEILHTLKMIRRHFYIKITDHTINNVVSCINQLRNNILRTLQGLEGQSDVAVEIYRT